MKTVTRLTFDKVRYDQTNDVHCAISLQAPKLAWEKKRPPVCILNVVDVSGSMAGNKLQYAKQSVLKLVDHLKPGDWCGLITFGSEVHEVSQPCEMTSAQKETLKSKVGSLQTSGCTNFSGGMLKALERAAGLDLPAKVQLRVIMFTDGHANQGVATDLAGLSKLLRAHRGRVSMSAFGYGTEADQDLLAELAKIGKGNYAFVRNPEDALTAFARELGGLLSNYATDIEVEVQPCNGHKITDVLSDVESEEVGKGVKIKLPNIFSEEEVHLVLGLTLSEQSKALPRKMNVANVSVSYKVLSEEGELETKTLKDKAKVRYTKKGEEQAEPTLEVSKIVSLAQLICAQIQAEEQAAGGNYAGAAQIMRALSVGLDSQGMHAYASVAEGLRVKMSSSVSYSASAGYRNSSKSLGTRAYSTPSSCGEAEADFLSLGVCTGNAAQEELVKIFTESDGTGAAVVVEPTIWVDPSPQNPVPLANPVPLIIPSPYVDEDVAISLTNAASRSGSRSKKRSSRW